MIWFYQCELATVKSDMKANASSISPLSERIKLIRSDEGLMLEPSAFEFLYSGQFTLSTQLIKPKLS